MPLQEEWHSHYKIERHLKDIRPAAIKSFQLSSLTERTRSSDSGSGVISSERGGEVRAAAGRQKPTNIFVWINLVKSFQYGQVTHHWHVDLTSKLEEEFNLTASLIKML